MLSYCANYTSSSQNSQSDNGYHHPLLFQSYSSIDYYPSHPSSKSSSLPVFNCSTSPHLSSLSTDTNLFSNDNAFLIKYNDNDNIVVSPTNISNTSSPSRYRVLNTPERVRTTI